MQFMPHQGGTSFSPRVIRVCRPKMWFKILIFRPMHDGSPLVYTPPDDDFDSPNIFYADEDITSNVMNVQEMLNEKQVELS